MSRRIARAGGFCNFLCTEISCAISQHDRSWKTRPTNLLYAIAYLCVVAHSGGRAFSLVKSSPLGCCGLSLAILTEMWATEWASAPESVSPCGPVDANAANLSARFGAPPGIDSRRKPCDVAKRLESRSRAARKQTTEARVLAPIDRRAQGNAARQRWLAKTTRRADARQRSLPRPLACRGQAVSWVRSAPPSRDRTSLAR